MKLLRRHNEHESVHHKLLLVAGEDHLLSETTSNQYQMSTQRHFGMYAHFVGYKRCRTSHREFVSPIRYREHFSPFYSVIIKLAEHVQNLFCTWHDSSTKNGVNNRNAEYDLQFLSLFCRSRYPLR